MDSALRVPERATYRLGMKADWGVVGILLLIFLSHAASNILVVALDTAPPINDEAMYFELSQFYSEPLRRGDAQTFFQRIRDDHPPLHRLISVPFYFLFGASLDIAILSALPAALILTISMYHIGKNFGSRSTGLLAAGLTMLLPTTFAFSRIYYPDFTLMTITALSLALMLKSEGFSSKRYSLAFGASAGIGLLVKWSYPLFVIGPLIIYCYHSLRNVPPTSRNFLRERLRSGLGLALAASLCLAIAGPWYLQNYREALSFVAGPKERFSIFSMERLVLYLSSVYTAYLGPAFAIVLLPSLVILLRKREKGTSLALAWFVVPLVVHLSSFIWLNNPRFLIPAIPALSLIISLTLSSLPTQWKRRLTLAVVLIGLVQAFTITFLVEPRHSFERGYVGSPTLDRRDWHIREVTDTLNRLIAFRPSAVMWIFDSYQPLSIFFLRTLQLEGKLLPFTLAEAKPCPDWGMWGRSCEYGEFSSEDFEEMLAGTDLLLLPEASIFSPYPSWNNFLLAWNVSKPHFIRILGVALPEGAFLEIYVRGSSKDFLYAENESDHIVRNTSHNFTVPLEPGTEPLLLDLHYQTLTSSVAYLPEYWLEVNGVTLSPLPRTPIFPPQWENISISLPPQILRNGTLEISIVNRAAGGDSSSIALKEARISYW